MSRSLIERTARGTLSELRSLLGVLRKDESAPLHPQRRLEQLDDLLEQTRQAGIKLESRAQATVSSA
ncbi:MAG: hypothetical protein ACYDCC_00395 [Actinomycetota bacterium]